MSGDDIGGVQPSRRDLRRAESSTDRRHSPAPAQEAAPAAVDGAPASRRERRTAPPVPTAPASVRASLRRATPASGTATGPNATTRPADRRRANPARVFAAILVIPAIVGTVALPAYAFVPGSDGDGRLGLFRSTLADGQDLDVSALASNGAVSTDAYAVTTKAEIDRLAAEQEAANRASWAASVTNRSGAYYTPAQQAAGDDYPWWNETPDDYGGGLSPLRYYFRECVDFVAWRMNRDAGVTSPPWRWDWGNLASGSAYSWADEWVRRGRETSSTPIVGSVAWFPYNHVAYVQAVNSDGTVTIEEYNQNSDHSYHVRTIGVGEALYLYPPT